MIGKRSSKTVVQAFVKKQHYIAMINMVKYYPQFLQNFKRYFFGSGEYPYDIKVKTPLGIIEPRLYHYHDLLTVNEIFCRQDYKINNDAKVFVDLGSNIGISALFFLTRNKNSKCYLFEPNPKNLDKLTHNLSDFSSRYSLAEKAVSSETGRLEFGVEDTGRYGGLHVETGQKIIVDCLNVNDVLEDILAKEDYVDCLKIDTEGVEIDTVQAIKDDLIEKVKVIHIEAEPENELSPLFYQSQYGSVCSLYNKKFYNKSR